MATIFDTIEKGLDKYGFDLCQPFSIEDYNDNVSDVYKIPSFGRENTLAILVGNSRYIWKKFIGAIAADKQLFDDENPLDTYTKQAIDSTVATIHIKNSIFYSSDAREEPYLNFQLIAEISGMCKRSYASKMCYHNIFGHWIGLRAVIVFDYSYVYNLSTKHLQDFEICKECDSLYGKKLSQLCSDKDMSSKYRRPDVWRSWLTLRTICTHNKYNYSYEQACYHYSKNKRILVEEVMKYKAGEFEEKFDWLDDFNRDPEHYRIDLDVL